MTSAAALLSGQTPLAVRMRPVSLDEVAGQKHLLRAGSPIVALADPAASSPGAVSIIPVSYTHLTLPTIYSV